MVFVFTEDSSELSEVAKEALNCAVLDTCCSSSVSGKAWLDFYLESLYKERRGEVRGPLTKCLCLGAMRDCTPRGFQDTSYPSKEGCHFGDGYCGVRYAIAAFKGCNEESSDEN